MQKPRRPPPPRPRKHRRHGNVVRARWGVVVIFCLLCVVEGLFLNALPIGVPGIATPAIFGSALWITALLIAIWLRNAWARLLLMGLFAIIVIGSIIMAPNTLDPKDRDLLMAYCGAGLVAMGAGAYLAASRDIYRLTSRDRE